MSDNTQAINGTANQTIKMPEFFDARSKWGGMCKSIKEVHNQGRCRSGWVCIQILKFI